jgi:hypothetical protein
MKVLMHATLWLPLALLIILTAAASAVEPLQRLPDPHLTPGVADRGATTALVCTTKWGKNRRHVTAAMRRQVFRDYGMTGAKDPYCQHKGCELDHLISRERGGADDVRNLWPEPNAGLGTPR